MGSGEKTRSPADTNNNSASVISQVFRRYDIRGLYPAEVSEKLALRLGLCVGAALPEEGAASGNGIVVGRDNRPSSEALQDALVAGLTCAGFGIHDVGVGTSDFVALSGARLKARLSIIVTASHLSIQHNGFKFMYTAGNGLMNEDMNRIKKEVLNNKSKTSATIHAGRRCIIEDVHDDMLETYLKILENHYRKKYYGTLDDSSIVVDTADGPATLTIPPLLERLGVERIIPAHCDMSKAFRRESDPTMQNTSYLPKLVLEEKADLAIATDIDADRLAAFDSNGHWIDGDSLFCIFAMNESLAGAKDTVIASIDTSQALNEVCKADIVWTRIGDPFVTYAAIKHNASLTGEPNGHYCDPTLVPYNSATFFGTILSGMCANDMLNDCISRIPGVFRTNRTISVPEGKERLIAQSLKKIESDPKKILVSMIDGVKFATDASMKTHVLIRTSGTEPVLRINVQSTKSLSDAELVMKKTITEIKQHMEHH